MTEATEILEKTDTDQSKSSIVEKKNIEKIPIQKIMERDGKNQMKIFYLKLLIKKLKNLNTLI